MTRFEEHLRPAAAALLLIGLGMGCHAARATQILSDSHMLQGTSVISDVGYAFTVSGPGTLEVSLQDLSWPTSSLSDLSFSANSAKNAIGQFTGAGMASYDITGAGMIYAYVTGEATNPATGPQYGVGLYTLTIDFTPSAVPLPASLGLLLLAFAAFAVLQRRMPRRAPFPVTHSPSI